MHETEYVLENELLKILFNFDIKTDHPIQKLKVSRLISNLLTMFKKT